MKAALRITLKAGERIYVNGAVIRVDRKVALEFLNNVTFLIEHHVVKPEETTTPLRQLYFMIQTTLMEPGGSAAAVEMAARSLQLLESTFANGEVLEGLAKVKIAMERQRYMDALKVIRSLFPIEDSILNVASAMDVERVAACK